MILSTFQQSDMIIITVFVTMFSMMIALLMIILWQTQRHNKELIGTMRDSYEKQIYLMNDKLTASMDRWKDVNHLVIGSQRKQVAATSPSPVHFSTFLKANGILREDIELEPDLVFILMPFNNRYDPVYKIIQEACQGVGLRCMRGDEEFIRGDILPHILKIMCKANVVIANIDGRNANVFYELGLAHAMDKNTLLVSKTVEDLPIDVKSKKIIVYQNLAKLGLLLKDELLRLAYTRKNDSASDAIIDPWSIDIPDTDDEKVISDALLGYSYRLFFNPKVPGLSKTKIIRFGPEGRIVEGRNDNEAMWRIRNKKLELIDSNGRVHSCFRYNPVDKSFLQEYDPESGTVKKHGISGQYMILEQ